MSAINSASDPAPRIQRTFYELSQDEPDIEMELLRARMRWGRTLDWEKLLESPRVLIISEAGAGKTYECQAQQQVLWSKGEPAFHVELARLATSNLSELLSSEEKLRLEAWRVAQSEVATFFLDSIDELKLTQGSFRTALTCLSKAVEGKLGRVRIIITARPVAFDRHLVEQYLPVPEQQEPLANAQDFADRVLGRDRQSKQDGSESPPIWRTVALLPLSEIQIRQMAEILGVVDPAALLAAIHARNALDFARRPQDLIELCADWSEYHRIRTHRQQVEHNVCVKLKPRTDRGEPAELSPDRAREGAERLALAALLTRKLTIRFSAEADLGGPPGTALAPELVLHDWTAQERSTLLERALFGFASYGRVRFHHRSVIEFLAAERLRGLLAQGKPIRAIKRLLFAETAQALKVVRPSLCPVAVWLAASQPSIFSEVCAREPEALLEHADPESLSLGQRTQALRSYVQHYGQGDWRGLHAPAIQVERFASPDLESVVNSLWAADIKNHEVRELLLQLMGAGSMHGCADIAHQVAGDAGAHEGERLDAISALIQLDDERAGTLAPLMLEQPEFWPDTLVRSALIRLLPRHVSPVLLCALLQRVWPATSIAGDGLLLHDIGELSFPAGYLQELRAELESAITAGLVWNSAWPHLVSQHPCLTPILAAVCSRLLQEPRVTVDVLRSSAIALRLGREAIGSDRDFEGLRTAVAALAPAQREAAFWADDTFCEGLHTQLDPWRRLCRVWYDGGMRPDSTVDGRWMRQVLADTSRELVERAMMLHALRWMGSGVHTSRLRAKHREQARSYRILRAFVPNLQNSPVGASLLAMLFAAGLYWGGTLDGGQAENLWVRTLFANSWLMAAYWPLIGAGELEIAARVARLAIHAGAPRCAHTVGWMELQYIESLRVHVMDQPELLALIDRFLTPPETDPDTAEFEARSRQARQEQAASEAEKHAQWMAFWTRVAESPEQVFSAEHEEATVWGLWRAMRRLGRNQQGSGWSRRLIEQYFSVDVADQLRRSLCNVWRREHPTLPSERAAESRWTFPVRWELGLASIAAESEDPDWARRLSPEEAQLAARYVLVETSEFPAWLEPLGQAHPDAVMQILGAELAAELDEVERPGSYGILLQHVGHASAAVARLFLPCLQAWLGRRSEWGGSSTSAGRLRQVLDILLQHGGREAQDQIRDMAQEQLHCHAELMPVWLAVLLRLDPAAGMDALEGLLQSSPPEADGAAVGLLATLFGDRHSALRVNPGSAGFTPTLLLRLTKLAYQQVRLEDDIRHDGVYSPGARDHAQDGRSAVLNALLETTGSEAWQIKLQMAADPLFAHFRDRLALLAREKEAESADGAVLTEREVAELNRHGEAPPKTRDEMFALLVDRLDDLDDLLLQDVSPRETWALIKQEKLMRREIARVLREASRGLYQVDQEAVTADEKETDIRLRAESGQQATIELKLGENWSGRVLHDTIRNQLVRRYMAAEDCRSGCLLVTVAESRTWEHPETGASLDVDGLRRMLEEEAERVVQELGGCLRILIKVLDLRSRLG